MLRPLFTSVLVLLCAAALVLRPSDCAAQDPVDLSLALRRNTDAQTFRPAPGPYNYLTVAGARVEGDPAWTVGAYFNYAHEPVVLYDAACDPPSAPDDQCAVAGARARPVRALATFNLLGAFTLVRRLQVAIDVPIAVESGDLLVPTSLANAGESQTRGAIADPRVELKLRVLGAGTRGFAMAVALFGQLPTARWMAPSAFLGDGSTTFGGRVIADWRGGIWGFAFNLGVLVRPDTLLATRAPDDRVYVLGAADASRWTFSGAASVDLTPRLSALVEMFGSTDIAFRDALRSTLLEADVAARLRVGDLALTLGGGSAIVRGLGGPVPRVLAGAMYSPQQYDTDNDGFPDSRDHCPTSPEDRDGFQDEDGCPEPDNDQDGVPDAQDRCPNAPEDRDGHQDTDGCPDPDDDGDGVPDGYDTCPNAREDYDGDRDDDGCPDNDRDRDGIPDEVDQCPRHHEDRDGFQDEDGCPDWDNDNDYIPDYEDACPNLAETDNGYEDDDGCPDALADRDGDGIEDAHDRCPDARETYNSVADDDGCPDAPRALVEPVDGAIRLLQPIVFAPGSDSVASPRSLQTLEALANALRGRHGLLAVDIVVHVRAGTPAAVAGPLSERRANTVRDFLTVHGVNLRLLNPRGFGAAGPGETEGVEVRLIDRPHDGG